MNSGSSRAAVAAYVRKNRVNWPVIVDADRSFEKLNAVPEVSLKNIMRMQIITAKGQVISVNPGDLQRAAERALEGASWNVDPAGIPAPLKSTWAAVEYGSFPRAAPLLKRHLNSKKTELKEAAEKLQEYIQKSLDEQVKAAADALQAEKKWDAYKGYAAIEQDFKGFDIPADVPKQVKALAADEAVKKELAALKQLQTALRIVNSKSISARKRAIVMLKKLTEEHGETEAAATAKRLLGNTP